MKYNIRGDKMVVTDAIKDYTENKLSRLEKYFKDDDITAMYNMNNLISNMISRLYLVFILTWLVIFTLYTFTITKYKERTLKEYKSSKLRKIINAL